MSHIHVISKALDDLSKKYDNFILSKHLLFEKYFKQKTYFKKPDRPSCIDLILTNFYRSFQDTFTVETGLSDLFRSERHYELSKLDVCNLEFEHFSNIFIEVLNKHAHIEKKYLRANQGEFMTKELNKTIMTRSRLCNKYLKEKSADSKIAYDKHRNYCINLLRRSKKKYFANISFSSISDNEKF